MKDIQSQFHSRFYILLCLETFSVLVCLCVLFKSLSLCAHVSFHHVRAPLWEDVLCMEFIFHWELLVQIRAAEIINERKRVQQGKKTQKRVYWRKESKGEEGMGWSSASWELFLISQAESHALSHTLWPKAPPVSQYLFSFLSFSPLHILNSQHHCSVYPLLYSTAPPLFLVCLALDIHRPPSSFSLHVPTLTT